MRVVVGMSGGVDSSVAALLMKRAGHEVIGVFMKNWEEKDENGVCTSERDWADVRSVCEALDIPYYSVNFAKQYYERVFEHFLSEYRKGRTPNPDVLCNREIKFNVFLDFAERLGAEKLVTGHFANIDRVDGEYRLLRAKDENKDQTYFLYMLGQRALSKALFPVGNLTKAEIRDIAREAGLPVSEKKDSTGVCFIGERNFKQFLSGFLPAQPGDMVTPEGKVVGRHDGLMYYTLGQRRGLGIGGGGNGQRWFVLGKDLEHNRLIVSQGEDDALFSRSATGSELTWLAERPPVAEGEPLDCQVRLRHRQPLQDCRLTLWGGKAHMAFTTPQRAVTPGQSAVFYQGQVCLGGAIVD
ncbi:MAG: tRNA 2-thiouridine(34) synthase MnmA [Clostridia bacterium]|nr:tRNA 2-thiouridine(34) synthase MnmA [Clostridia bacterium]